MCFSAGAFNSGGVSEILSFPVPFKRKILLEMSFESADSVESQHSGKEYSCGINLG
jgi:hypothetical protein